jgi:hypothetical protein
MDCEGFAMYMNNEYNRMDVSEEFTNSELAQLLAIRVRLPLDDNVLEDANKIDIKINSSLNHIKSNMTKMRRFLNESLVPESVRKSSMSDQTLKVAYMLDLVSNKRNVSDMTLRDSLSNLNKLVMYNRKSYLKVESVVSEDVKTSRQLNSIKFQYPLLCTPISAQVIENFSLQMYGTSLLQFFANLRVLLISDVNNALILRIYSISELNKIFGNENTLEFIYQLLNNKNVSTLIDFYKIRNCISYQFSDIYSNGCFRTLPVCAVSSSSFDGVTNVGFRFTGVNAASEATKAFIATYLPNNNANEVPCYISFYDVITASTEITHGHPTDLDGKLVGSLYESESVIVGRALIAELKAQFASRPDLNERHVSILRKFAVGENNGINLTGTVFTDALLKLTDNSANELFNFKHIFKMCSGLPREQINAFISFFIDVTQVVTIYRLYAMAENLNWTSLQGCGIGVFLSYLSNPEPIPNMSNLLMDSFKACVNYGLISVININALMEFEFSPSEVPYIIYVASNNGACNVNIEQIFTLYGGKLLDQLMPLRHTNYFYENIRVDSFKYRLKLWLEQYFPGFLKPPIVNPFDMVSKPFIHAPMYRNTIYPDRSVMLPDVTTFRDYNN